MAKPTAIAAKLSSLEGKLNTFATLVTEKSPREPIYQQTFDAIYKELEDLKVMAGGGSPTEDS